MLNVSNKGKDGQKDLIVINKEDANILTLDSESISDKT